MDTTWFAVDRDGHVGVFTSGEPGAVPEGAPPESDDVTLDALQTLPEIGEPTLDMAGVVHPGRREGARPRKRKIPVPTRGDDDVQFAVVEPALAVDEVLRAVPEIVTRPFGPFTILSLSWRDVSRDDTRVQAWAAFLRAGNASPWFVTGASAWGDQAGLGRRGVFVYEAHDERYNIAEPYGRLLVPPQPLRAHEMPRDVQRALAKIVRLDVSFADEAYVQPAELGPCALWSSAIYLARDGRTVRAIKGHEVQAREEAGCLDDDNDDFEPVIFDPLLTEG